MKVLALLNTPIAAIVDSEDYERLCNYAWRLTKGTNCVYRMGLHGHKIPLGAEVLNQLGKLVDHINHNPLDNQKHNLRVASYKLNNHNKRKKIGTKSAFIGVTQNAGRSSWRSCIRLNGKKVWLGTFKSEIEAAKAYDAAAFLEYGASANLNF